MKHLLLISTLAFATAGPAFAEDDPLPDLLDQLDEFSEQTRDFLEGWAEQLGPTLEELGPALGALSEQIGDWSLYEAPEVLPNGDIIIRRKQKTEPEDGSQPESETDQGIEL